METESQITIGIQGTRYINKNLRVIKIINENGIHSFSGSYSNLSSLLSELGISQKNIQKGLSNRKTFDRYEPLWQVIANKSGKNVVLIKGHAAPRIFAEIKPKVTDNDGLIKDERVRKFPENAISLQSGRTGNGREY